VPFPPRGPRGPERAQHGDGGGPRPRRPGGRNDGPPTGGNTDDEGQAHPPPPPAETSPALGKGRGDGPSPSGDGPRIVGASPRGRRRGPGTPSPPPRPPPQGPRREGPRPPMGNHASSRGDLETLSPLFPPAWGLRAAVRAASAPRLASRPRRPGGVRGGTQAGLVDEVGSVAPPLGLGARGDAQPPTERRGRWTPLVGAGTGWPPPGAGRGPDRSGLEARGRGVRGSRAWQRAPAPLDAGLAVRAPGAAWGPSPRFG